MMGLLHIPVIIMAPSDTQRPNDVSSSSTRPPTWPWASSTVTYKTQQMKHPLLMLPHRPCNQSYEDDERLIIQQYQHQLLWHHSVKSYKLHIKGKTPHIIMYKPFFQDSHREGKEWEGFLGCQSWRNHDELESRGFGEWLQHTIPSLDHANRVHHYISLLLKIAKWMKQSLSQADKHSQYKSIVLTEQSSCHRASIKLRINKYASFSGGLPKGAELKTVKQQS